MAWEAVELEIALEMRALSQHERGCYLDVYVHERSRESKRENLGPKAFARLEDRNRDKSDADKREAALLAAGDMKALRAYQARRRAWKQRKKAAA